MEREGQALIAQLSDGVLRRTAEQQLEQALQAPGPEQPTTRPAVVPVLLEPSAGNPWSYPDSVDRFQGFTGEIVRVLMNCCS